MGWFDSVNVDDVPDNPNELPNNTYLFEVISAVLGPTKDKSKTGITFKYQIVEGAWSSFFPIVDWVRVPDANCTADEIPRMLSYLKMRLLAFGFSPEEIQEFGKGDELKCLRRRFYGTTFLKSEDGKTQIRVNKFDSLDTDNDDSDGIADVV